MNLETLISFNWSIMTPEFIILGVAALLTLIRFIYAKKTRSENSWLDRHCWRFLLRLFHLAGLVDMR